MDLFCAAVPLDESGMGVAQMTQGVLSVGSCKSTKPIFIQQPTYAVFHFENCVPVAFFQCAADSFTQIALHGGVLGQMGIIHGNLPALSAAAVGTRACDAVKIFIKIRC